MANTYQSIREEIISTLTNRKNGHEIQPSEHQSFALNILDYIRNIELLANGPLLGVATPLTNPIQPDNSRACYIAGIKQNSTIVFSNFRNESGNPISITNGFRETSIAILMWNGTYWSVENIPTSVIVQSELAYYDFIISKTYSSISEMNADVSNPIGNNGYPLLFGQVVSVHNDIDSREDAIYSYENNPKHWQLQMRLSAVDSRIFDGGRADSVYGGSRNINAGNAQG